MPNPHPDNEPLFATSYFPPIAYMAALMRMPFFSIEQQDTFPKQTHRNRTVIVTAGGLMTLSVPVVRPQGTHTRTADMGISYAERWNVIHWRALEAAYNASPYFLYYRDEVEQILMNHYDRLIELNDTILRFLLKKLKLSGNYNYTTQYLHQASHDYRNRFDYKRPEENIALPSYAQVFADRMPFQPHVSVLDLLFNLGPEAREYLHNISL